MHTRIFPRLVVTLLLAVFAASLWAAPESAAAIRRFGLFVGANNGGKERIRLQWAVSDVQRMSQVMLELGGMQESDVIILTDPRLNDVQQAIARMRSEVNKAQGDARRVEFMFYYSGHSDDEGLLLGDDKFMYRALRQAITEVKADVSIAILDSCASGAFTRQKGGVRVQPFLVDGSSDMKGYAFLTSASENEAAQESDRLGASFFTYYLVSALRGAANKGDNRITLNDAYKYAFDETLARTESTTTGPQHASYDINLSGTGDLVLSDLSQPSASLVLKEDLEGRVSIRDQKGYLVMEINKNPGRILTVALQPGSYNLRIETSLGVYTAPARLAWHQNAQVSKQDFLKSNLLATRSRGGTKIPDQSLPQTVPESEEPDQTNQTAQTDSVDAQKESINPDRVLDIAHSRYRDIERNRDNDRPNQTQPQQQIPESSTDNPKNPLTGIGPWELINEVITQAQSALESVQNPPDPTQEVQTDKPDGASASYSAEPVKRVGFHVALVPGIASSGKSRMVFSTFSLSPLIISVYRNNGMMLSGLINFNDGMEEGFQIAGLFNTSADLVGAQLGGVANINTGSTLGFQGSGLFNISKGSTRGVQVAGLFNSSGVATEGAQIGGLFNIAGGTLSGVQIAGVFNYTGSTQTGVQIAGLVNISNKAKGLMIAPVNIAKSFDGLPIGLINLIQDGIHDFSVWLGGDDRIYTGFQNGSRNYYSKFFAGIRQSSIGFNFEGLVLGYGMGTRLRIIDPLYMDVEIDLKHASRGSNDLDRRNSLFQNAPGENTGIEGIRLVPSLRLVAGLDFKFLKGFIGVNFDFFAPALMRPSAYYGKDPLFAMDLHLGSLPITINPQVDFGISISI